MAWAARVRAERRGVVVPALAAALLVPCFSTELETAAFYAIAAFVGAQLLLFALVVASWAITRRGRDPE